jgi:hypothetical protein
VPEWLNGRDWKSRSGGQPRSRVRIPPSPLHGHHRITIDPAAENAAAIRAYEKVGFRPVGVMRRYERDVDGDGWHDGLLMELLAGP